MSITATERTQIVELTTLMFNAAPGATYLSQIVALYESNGRSLSTLAGQLAQTSVYQSLNPTFQTSAEFATKFLSPLGLQNDAVATDFIVSRLNAGASKASVVVAAFNALNGIATTDAAIYQTAQKILTNKTAVAEYYSATLLGSATDLASLQNVISSVADTQASVDAAKAALQSTTGQTFTLTASVDNITGTAGNDTINATITGTSNPLGGLDVVDGGAGTDSLNIADTATVAAGDFALPAGFTVKNVEALNLTTNGAIGTKAGTAFDLTGMTGLTSFVGVAAGAGTASGSNIKAASTTDVTLTVTGTNQIDIAGGKAVTTTNGGVVNVTGSGLTSVTVNKAGTGGVTIDNTDASATSAAGTTLTSVTLNSVDANSAVKGKGITTISLSGATTAARTVTVTDSTTSHSLTVNANGTGYTAAGAAAQTVVTDTVATSATVNTTAKSSLDLSNSTAVKTVTLTGSGALTLAAMGATTTTIDGSAASGNLTLGTLNAATVNVKTGSGNDNFTATTTNKLTIDAGAGNDIVTLTGALVAGSTVSLGAGDDHLIGTTAPLTSSTVASVIDGGDGTDTVSAAMINAGNASLFKNFEGLSLNSGTGLDVALLTGNTISTLYIDSASTTATYQNVTPAMGLNVTYVGDNSAVTNTLSMTGASGTADVFNITFAGDNSAGSTPSSANVKAGTIAAAAIENFNIVSGGTKAWNSIVLGADTAAQKVVISGASNLDLTFSGAFGSTTSPNTGVSLIDGSAATGKLSINTANVTAATAGLTVNGGSANDTITLAQKATVNAGAGNDSIVVSSAGGTLTGGAGTDTFNVAAAVAGSTTAPVITTINDASTGDLLQFVDQGTETFTTAKVDVSTATALFGGTVNALDLALAGDGSAAGAIKWFQYGGNTYVVEDLTAGATLATTDLVIKIVGLVDLSTATGAGTNVITLA